MNRLVALLLLTAAPLAAQTPRYEVGDATLKYRETTFSLRTLESNNGLVNDRVDQTAELHLRLTSPTAGRAWYMALALRLEDPQGIREPLTKGMLGPWNSFELTHDARGHVRPSALPLIPEGVDSITDLQLQFDDFLLPLPEAPMIPGLEWQDSVVRRLDDEVGKSLDYAAARQFRVVRDTMTAFGPAWLIAASADLTLRATSAQGPHKGMTIRTESAGTESGTILWDRTRGRMLRRTRSGEMSGAVHVEGIPQPIRLPQLRRFETTIELLP